MRLIPLWQNINFLRACMKKTKKLAKIKKKVPLLKKKKLTAKPQKSKKQLANKRQKRKVSAIPKGYTSITPYLIVQQANQAIQFYKEVFGAKEVMRMEHPSSGKITHAELKIGDAKMMLADVCPQMDARSPQDLGGSPVGIHLYTKNVDAVVERAIAAGAKLFRPVENMFYGDRIGVLEDPYGHKWYVSTHIENISVAKVKKRATEWYEKNQAQKESEAVFKG